MSTKRRTKTQQLIAEIVADPQTISDVMIAIDRLRYRLGQIEEAATNEAKTQIRYASVAMSHARSILIQANH